MGYDPFCSLAPALVNILCVPATRIQPEIFQRYIQWLQENAKVVSQPWTDPTSHGGDNSSQPSTSTALLFDFDTSPSPVNLQNVYFFEPNGRATAVLGIVEGSSFSSKDFESDMIREKLQQVLDNLRQTAARASIHDAAIRVAVFDPPVDVPLGDVLSISTRSTRCAALDDWLITTTTFVSNRVLEELSTEEVELPRTGHKSDRANGGETRPDSRAEDGRRHSVVPSLASTPTQTTPPPQNNAEAASTGRIVSGALIKLQMGRWAESLDQLVIGARAARDANSPAWHAKSLEGILICMLLLAWAGQVIQIPQDCYPLNSGLSSRSAVHSIAEANRVASEKFTSSSTNHLQRLTAMLPGLLSTVLNLYDRSTLGYDNALPPSLACEARVRLGKMLIAVQKHGCAVNDSALQALVGSKHRLPDSKSLQPPTTSLVLRSSLLADLLIEAIVEAQSQMPLWYASSIYLQVCQSLSEMNLERKQGFYLKDVLQKLIPLLIEARKAGAAEATIHLSLDSVSAPATVREPEQRTIQGVQALLRLALTVFGLPVFPFEAPRGLEDVRATAAARLSSWLSVFIIGDIAPKLEILRLCVRVSDAVPDLRGSVEFMSLVLFIARRTITVTNGFANAVPLISAEEQSRLTTGVKNAVNTAQRQGLQHVSIQYWDDFLVRGIELVDPSGTGRLVPHSSQDLSHTTTSGTAKKDPFIYNPFSEGRAVHGPAVLVKEEMVSFGVLLQNPLEIDIEVETISLITEGCAFEAQSHSVVVGPLCVQTFTLTGVPKATGTFKVIGCRVKIKNCLEQDFIIFDGLWKPINITKRQRRTAPEIKLPSSKTLELKVTERLPQLHVSSTDLVQRSLMLLDGEKTTIDMTLDNSGDISADLVLFSYQDPVSRHLQEALSTKDLQPADTYELQYQLTSRPAVRRLHKESGHRAAHDPANIDAHSKATFRFEVLGKPGLTEAVILIDYAYLGKPRNEIEGTFYTRQLRFVVNVTVNGSVDIPRCNVLSMPVTSPAVDILQINGEAKASDTVTAHSHLQDPGECLLQLDLRSIWQFPVTFTIETQSNPETLNAISEPQWHVATSGTLQPTLLQRALLLLPRIYISNPTSPIPSLSADNQRQFVVSASKVSLEADLSARESFWYREELCKRLRITWKEDHGSGRYGEIDVRKGIRLTPRMIDSLRVEHVQINFSIVPTEEEEVGVVTRKPDGGFEVKRNVFLRLIATVHNLSQEELRLLLRLQPALHDQPANIAMDLSKKFMWSGVLQSVLREIVKPGGTVESELGIVVLAKGVYEVNATVEEVRSRRKGAVAPKDGHSAGDAALSSGERRIWHARRPCLIEAVD